VRLKSVLLPLGLALLLAAPADAGQRNQSSARGKAQTVAAKSTAKPALKARVAAKPAPAKAAPRSVAAKAAPKPAAKPAKVAAKPEPKLQQRVVAVGKGDTLMDLLVEADVPRPDAQAALAALDDVYDLRRLQVGQKVSVLLDPANRDVPFVGLELTPDVVTRFSVRRSAGGAFGAKTSEQQVERKLVAEAVAIRDSLYGAGEKAGIPAAVLHAFIKTYSHSVDFQRDIQPGDSFEVLYERLVTPGGEMSRSGDIVYANLRMGGKELPVYRWVDEGVPDYFDRKGETVRKALLRTPVDGARITSTFGMRHHPILGFSKMHKGIDFGAPTGTPIFAAGNGVVEHAGPFQAYGNYIRLRHNKEIATAYAHLSRFASGLSVGDKVRQGDVIGYVGSTGRSTGPHLHYEILKGGAQVNPLSVDLPIGRRLEGRELKAFEARLKEIDRLFIEERKALVAQTRGTAKDDEG